MTVSVHDDLPICAVYLEFPAVEGAVRHEWFLGVVVFGGVHDIAMESRERHGPQELELSVSSPCQQCPQDRASLYRWQYK